MAFLKLSISATVMAILASQLTIAAPMIEYRGVSDTGVTLNIPATTNSTKLTKRGITNSHTIHVPVENATRGPMPAWTRRPRKIEQPKNAPRMSSFFNTSPAAIVKRSAKNTTVVEGVEVFTKVSGAAGATAEGGLKREEDEEGNTTITTITTTTTTSGTKGDAEAVAVVGKVDDRYYPKDYEDYEQYQSSNMVKELEEYLEELETAQRISELEFGIMPAEEEELEEEIPDTQDTTSFISTTTAVSNATTSTSNTTSAAPATSTTYITPTTLNTIVNSTASLIYSPNPTPPPREPESSNSMSSITVLSLNVLIRYCQSSPSPRDFVACACVVGDIELFTGVDIALVDAECFDILRHGSVIDVPVLEKTQGLWKRGNLEVDQAYCPVTIGTEGEIVIVEDGCLPKGLVEDLFLSGSYIEDQEQQEEQEHGLLSHTHVTKPRHKRGMDRLNDNLAYSPVKAASTQQQLSKWGATLSPKNHAELSRGGKLEKYGVGRVVKRGIEELERLDLGGLDLESDVQIETAVMGMNEDDLMKLLAKLENVLL